MNGYNEHLKKAINEFGLPETLVIQFQFIANNSVTFTFPINGDEVSIDLEATLEREGDTLLYKFTEEKLSVSIKNLLDNSS